MTNVLQATSHDVDIANLNTTASENINLGKDSDSESLDASCIVPHAVNATGDRCSDSDGKSGAMDEDLCRPTDIDDTGIQVNHGDDTNDAEMSVPGPPPLTKAKETPAPDWLGRMLVYLWGVSDSMEWQELVSALLKFENMNPPPGVGVFLNFKLDISVNQYIYLSRNLQRSIARRKLRFG